jgi:hypothetical protein
MYGKTATVHTGWLPIVAVFALGVFLLILAGAR